MGCLLIADGQLGLIPLLACFGAHHGVSNEIVRLRVRPKSWAPREDGAGHAHHLSIQHVSVRVCERLECVAEQEGEDAVSVGSRTSVGRPSPASTTLLAISHIVRANGSHALPCSVSLYCSHTKHTASAARSTGIGTHGCRQTHSLVCNRCCERDPNFRGEPLGTTMLRHQINTSNREHQVMR